MSRPSCYIMIILAWVYYCNTLHSYWWFMINAFYLIRGRIFIWHKSVLKLLSICLRMLKYLVKSIILKLCHSTYCSNSILVSIFQNKKEWEITCPCIFCLKLYIGLFYYVFQRYNFTDNSPYVFVFWLSELQFLHHGYYIAFSGFI